MDTTTAFPALTGQPVTEAHVATCRTRGHASHTIDGVDTGTCPRCGEPSSDPKAEAKLAEIEAATQKLQDALLLAGAGIFPWDRQRGAEQAAKARAELRSIWATVTTAEELTALRAALAARTA